ncbi:MAG: D-alanyl-D-alanine endopeptidase, partial [Acinetobacter sp.]|nr:D-alanyl-D-alanine endopeptidase [Acinetobacter sp.]
MKKPKKTLMHVLSLSVLLSLSSTGFAEIIMNSSGGSGQATVNWSSSDASQLLNGDSLDDDGEDISPKGSTTLTTTIRASNAAPTTLTNKSVQIYDTNTYNSQPSVNARAALVMDAKTGEVLFSKNTNMALPIASITKLMTAVITADARLNMSEDITLQQIDFAGAGGKNSSSTLKVGDTMNRAEMLLVALMKSENPAAAALART